MSDAPEDSHDAASGTRERILQVAKRLFAARGRNGVTMREIGREAGLTMPTLYHHFGDKSGLYDACAASVMASASDVLQRAVSRARAPASRLQAFASVLCEQLLGDPLLLAFLQMETLDGYARLEVLVPGELLDEVDAAFTREPVVAAEAMSSARRLLAFALGFAIVWRSGGSSRPPDAEALARTLVAAARLASGPPA